MVKSKRKDIFDHYQYIFWDFDGVIKDSVLLKSDAFEQLFLNFGKEISSKVRNHHEENGGMSRFDKLPIYLEWSGHRVTDDLIHFYSHKFSELVMQKVINSDWVPGALEYLGNNLKNQTFFLITATPQKEIEEILIILNIKKFFSAVIGSPVKKEEAIKKLLGQYDISKDKAVVIGDSKSDYMAARINEIPFILRKTNLNKSIQNELNCTMILDFKNG